MATEVNIGGDSSLFVGEDKTFRHEVLDVNGIPVNLTGVNAVFDVRKTDNAADPAIFSKTPSVIGVYDSVRAVNTQRFEISLTDDELNTVRAQKYRYSWKILDFPETVTSRGDFTPQKATAP